MLTGPTAFPTIGQNLLDAVVARFRTEGVTVPQTVGLVPAPVVWDDCDCGQLSVAVSRIVGSQDGRLESFGPEGGIGGGAAVPTRVMPTPPFLIGEFQVSVLRCSDASGDPSAVTLEAEARRGFADVHWTTVAVACELQRMLTVDDIEDYSLRDQPFLPSSGGCQGAQVNAAVSVNLFCPC